jgi:hypothetical protein
MEHLTFAIWSFVLSITALVITLWGRIETYQNLKITRRIELVKRVGDALLASQNLSNKLDQQKDLADEFLAKAKIAGDGKIEEDVFKEAVIKLNDEREAILLFLQAFERITMTFERGENVSIEQSMIEAKIAHFNQRAALCTGEINYLEREIGKVNELNSEF